MIYPPTIRKVNPADTPILVLAVTSDSLPLTVVDAYAENILLPKISQISGVGLVGIGGQQKPAIRVQVDPQALAARGIGLEDVRTVLGQANVDLPKGTLNSPRQTYTLNTNDQLLNPEAYNALIVAYRNGSPVRIRDIGKAVDGPENDLLAGWFNQNRAVILAHSTPAGRQCRSPRLIGSRPCCRSWRPRIPPAIKVSILSDRTQTIRASISDVQFTLMLTVALVVMVIFLFLRNLWATVIPAITVPLSLVGTFAVLYVLGYSLDNLSLMALDHRRRLRRRRCRGGHREHRAPSRRGRSRRCRLPCKGAGEIGFTILSITLVADRRLHPAVPDGRLCRAAVPRVRRHRERRSPALARHFADPDAHDVRAAAP